jgi:hypothetical protein
VSIVSQRMTQALASVEVKSDYIHLDGGLDEITPPFERTSGSITLGTNFEVIDRGGYRRGAGYERVDGRATPSDATYDIVQVSFITTPAAGVTLTGNTSTFTATVVAVVTTGAAPYLVVTKKTGNYTVGELLLEGATPRATVAVTNATGAASTKALNAEYRRLAADVYRVLIAAVPGEGAVRGVFRFNDVVYAIRNAVGGATSVLHKTTGSGWSAVPLGWRVAFSNGGTYQIQDGDFMEGNTSTATATISRVMLTSGSWAGNNAAGWLILSAVTGTFVAETIDINANVSTASIAGAPTAVTLSPGGKYETIITNFGGALGTRRVYGVDGVNQGFEFDGTVYAPIVTGMTTDAPMHVIEHEKHLCFSFGPSFQHSAPGTPYIWNVVLGASEIALGDDITGFASQPGVSGGGALTIFSRNTTHTLYGTGVANWALKGFHDDLGAYAYTIQDPAQVIYLDDRGVTDLTVSQNYGNFDHSALSSKMRDSLNAKLSLAVASCVCRKKNQYRLFFSDGSAYFITFSGRKVAGITSMQYPVAANVLWSGEGGDGGEHIYCGGTDGFVYEMERGTSFDGASIDASFLLAYNFQKSPRLNKRYRYTTVEVTSDSYAEFSIGYTLGYGAVTISQAGAQPVTADFARTQWDVFTWDAFTWDGISLAPSTIDCRGEGENVAFYVSSNSAAFESFDITALVIHYTQRKRLRA